MFCELRRFTWNDIKEHLNEIINMQLENIYSFHYPEKIPNRKYVQKKIVELENHLGKGKTYFFGAFKGNAFCGFIWFYETLFIDEKRIIISSLYVREDVRGTGLAHRLFDECKRVAKTNGCKTIGVHYAVINQAAGTFYKKHGFQPSRNEVVLRL